MSKEWLTNKEACEKLGISPRSLRRRVQAGKVERGSSPKSQSSRPYYRIPEFTVGETIEVNGELVVPMTSGEKANKSKVYNKLIRQYVEDVAALSANTSKTVKVLTPKTDTSLCILLSDTHFGKKTDFGFSTEVAKECVASIPGRLENEPIDFKSIGEVVLLLGGDMIEGEDIYGTQGHHIDSPVIKQAEACTRSIWQLAIDIRSKFKVPVRIETCPGNHGRMSKTAHEQSNWDNVVYQQLYLISEQGKDELITVNPNFSFFNTVDIQDKKCLLYHYGTKHTGTAAMKSKLAGWLHAKHWDLLVHGHYHKFEVGTLYGKPVIKNGSLTGYDDLAERMGEWDPPRQTWFLVNKNKPISIVGFLEFDHGKVEE